MKTNKPISSILYTDLISSEEISAHLDFYVECGEIENWFFIKHLPDKEMKKQHIHLMVRPAKLLDLVKFREHFKVVQDVFYAMPFRISVENEWLLYAIHKKEYMLTKNRDFFHEYSVSDILTNDKEYLDYLFYESIQDFNSNSVKKWIELFECGFTYNELVVKGLIPFNRLREVSLIYNAYCAKFYDQIKNGDELYEEM